MVASTSSFLLIRIIGSITDPANATFSATNINAKIVNNDAMKLQKVWRASIRRFRVFFTAFAGSKNAALHHPTKPRQRERPSNERKRRSNQREDAGDFGFFFLNG